MSRDLYETIAIERDALRLQNLTFLTLALNPPHRRVASHAYNRRNVPSY